MAGFAVNKAATTNVDKRVGSNIYAGTFIAEVMYNKDPQLAGRVWVFIPEFGGTRTEPESWVPVSYASPFYGISAHERPNTQGQQSQEEQPVATYGFWAISPDIGVKVLCTFINGNYTEGYWFAVVPTLAHGMIPANGAPDGKTPMMDFNPLSPKVATTEDLTSLERQPFEALTQQLTAQGIQEDPVRGPITSSSFRESPSRVFGISSQATPESPGHSFVMDDGDEQGKNKLVRIRTSSGNQITMNDDTGMIYMINASGTGWLEISPSGQIDVFGAAGINMATPGDINFHADNNINLHANNCIKIVATNGTKVMGGSELQLHGGKTMIEGVDSLHVHSCKEMMITSFGDIHMKAFNYFCLKGKCFYWNSCTAKEAEQVPPEQPQDVSGYQTTVARAPAHEPYKEHDSGQSQGAGGGENTGPVASDGNAFASGSGSPGGTSMGSFGGGGSGSYGVPGGVGAAYGQLQNTGGYKVVDIGKVTAGVSAMNNADYINNVTVHWTGNNNDTISGVVATMKQRNMGYNALYDPKTKTFYTQSDSLNLRTNGQLGSSNGSNNTNTYHVALIGGEGTALDEQDQANLKSFGKDLGNAVGKDVKVQTHGDANPGHKAENEGAVMQQPLQEGLNSSTKTKTDVKAKTASSTPATSVGKASPTSSKVVTPTKSTVSTKTYSNITNASSATVIKSPSVGRTTTMQAAVRTSSGATVTSKYTPATTSVTGYSAGAPVTTTKPSTITVSTTKTTQVGPNAGTAKTTTTTQTIDTSSVAANPYLGRGGAQPVGADPALANVKTPDQQPTGQFDSPNPADQAATTPAQDASAALDQAAGQAPASDIPAAPGGGGTGCFATGDNCERPLDQTSGGAGDPNANAPQTNYAANDPEGKAAAEAYLGRPMSDEEYNALVAATNAEAGSNQTEQAWVSGTILNRARESGLTVNQVLAQPGQFESVTGPGGASAGYINGPNASRASSINGSMKNILPNVPKNNYYFDAANPAAYKYGSMPTNRGGVAPSRIGASRFYPGAKWN